MKLDNAFVRLSDVKRSQELADCFERVDWIHVLGRYALRVNPLLRQKGVLHPGAVLLGYRPVRVLDRHTCFASASTSRS